MAMDKAQPDLLPLQRNVILGLLLALAAAAWAVLVWQHGDATMDMAMASPTAGLRAPLFLATWAVMMVAMMLPTALPMILTFYRVQQATASFMTPSLLPGCSWRLIWWCGHLRGLPLMPEC
jgi:predicted metal-binding membrane protein